MDKSLSRPDVRCAHFETSYPLGAVSGQGKARKKSADRGRQQKLRSGLLETLAGDFAHADGKALVV